MFTNVTVQLYSENPNAIRKLANDKTYVHIQYSKENLNADWFKIDTNLYLYKSNSTSAKISILNRIFEESDEEKNELIFKLQPINI